MDEFIETSEISNELVKLEEHLTQKLHVDPFVEKRYELMQRKFVERIEKGEMGVWLVGMLNKMGPREPLVSQDISGKFDLVTDYEEIDEFRRRYKVDFVRPIFTSDLADFQNVSRKLTGDSSSRGMNIKGGSLAADPTIRQNSLIISSSSSQNREFLIHELKHSIDPNFNLRHGKDKVLEEFSAFWTDITHPREVISVNNITGEQTGRIIESSPEKIAVKLKVDPTYFQQYREVFSSKDEYDEFIDKTAGVLTGLGKSYTNAEVDLAILNARSLSELERLLQLKNTTK